ncbi:gastrula zinc finger protein XlCGF26.1 [Folsomia candida]|uniref:gastrula zinc finger protein XlCGF26.1 n=1 Tax=Folsomia candida TaxID=158441 RepID=UPI000B907CD2|nr:gastrula zinc finger protein XlCGF26.1 [Folsomia candida]XP_035712263.1 gastrula zinc finger protein XlCGF26.1 [Folsomia candida]XP_035712264.1 gastrula zinc finger protein XlCGF26.1 [Folsomia candida]XP_035712265.1 gastrula zinc finger protein XlCGF26.1 [Folsomia candida]
MSFEYKAEPGYRPLGVDTNSAPQIRMGGPPMFPGRPETFPPLMYDRLPHNPILAGGGGPPQIPNSSATPKYELPSPSTQHSDDTSSSSSREEICPHCSNTYTTRHLLNLHVAQVHGKGGKGRTKIKCTHCPKSFHDQRTLRNHVNLIHKMGGFACTACGKKLSNNNNRVIHEINVCKVVWEKDKIDEAGVRVYHCTFDGCGKVCARLKDIERHMDIHVRNGKIRT